MTIQQCFIKRLYKVLRKPLRSCLCITAIAACGAVFCHVGHVHAATYYIDATGGNDNNAGTSPEQAWQTIFKLYKFTGIQPGDNILFKRGERWRMADSVQHNGSFSQPGAGTEGNPVTYGAYGTGDMPILDALSLYNDPQGWSQYAGDIWKYNYSYGSEILTNGDFESWTAGAPDAWTPSSGATITQETTAPYAGTSSLKLTVSAASRSVGQMVAVEPEKSYRYEAYIKSEGDVRATLGVYYEPGKALKGTGFNVYPEWTKVSGEFVVPPGVTQVDLRLYSELSGGVAYLDNVSITPSNGIDDIGRVFIDGTAVGKADSREAVSAQKKYFFDATNKELYLYSPNGNPAVQYTNPGVEGSDLSLSFQSSAKSYLTIDGLEFRGGRRGGVFFVSTGSNIHFKNSRITYYAGAGIVFLGETAEGIHHSSIINNYIDPFLDVSENSPLPGGGVLGDSVKLTGSASYNHIAHNTVNECSHAILELVALNPQLGGVNHNLVEHNTMSAPVSNYCRGVGVAGIEGKMDGNIIRNNYIYDTSVRNQVNGTNTQFYNNVITNIVGTPVHTNLDGDGIGVNSWDCSGTPCTAHDIDIHNNTIVNTVSTGIEVAPADHIAMTNIAVQNNIVHNTDTAYTNKAFHTRDAFGTITATKATHNLFYSPVTSDIISYFGSMITVDAFNNAAPLHDNTIASNISLAPQFTSPTITKMSDVYPAWNSPAIDSGTPIPTITTDINNNPIYGPPDIGAYEYQPPYTMGIDNIDQSANIRVYGDGKFRNTQQPQGTTVPLSIIPTSNNTHNYMDVTIDTWTDQKKTMDRNIPEHRRKC